MIVVSLFDVTGNMVKPWLDAGYTCYIVDIQHPLGETKEGNLIKVGADLRKNLTLPIDTADIAFVSAFPPCTHLAVSGAQWFKGKGLRALEETIGMFATAAEFCEWSEAAYMIENPVSTISTYWRKPDHTFQPWMFTGYSKSDNYTKKTCLWTGNHFTMPEAFVDDSLGPPDKRLIHMYGSAKRGDVGSITPMGFAHAVFDANRVY